MVGNLNKFKIPESWSCALTMSYWHHVTHDIVLCIILSTSDVRHVTMRLVNCLLFWTSTFQHHLFCSFLDGASADYDDLQLHCGVYGFNKEKVLKRLWALKKEIQPFLQEHRLNIFGISCLPQADDDSPQTCLLILYRQQKSLGFE